MRSRIAFSLAPSERCSCSIASFRSFHLLFSTQRWPSSSHVISYTTNARPVVQSSLMSKAPTFTSKEGRKTLGERVAAATRFQRLLRSGLVCIRAPMNRGGERSHDPGRRSATLLFWGWQTRTARSGQQAHGPEQGVAAEQEWTIWGNNCCNGVCGLP